MSPTPATPIEMLWNVTDVMKFLNCRRTFVYEHARSGDLPHVRIGNFLRFEPDQVREWVKRNRNTALSATVLPIAGGRR